MDKALKKTLEALILLLPAALLAGQFLSLPGAGSVNALTVIIAAAAVLGCVYIARTRPRDIFGESLQYCAVYIVSAAWAALSLSWVLHPEQSLYPLMYKLIGTAAVLAVTAYAADRRRLGRIMVVSALCWAAVLALGIFEIFTGIYIFRPRNPELALRSFGGLRFPYACFQNTNDFATYITLLLPFALWPASRRGAAGRAAVALGFAAAAFALCAAGARACILALALMAAAFAAALVIRRAGRGRILPLLAAVAAACAAAVFALLRLIAALKPGDSVSMADHSVNERWMLTLGALKMLRDHMLAGVGVGGSTQLVPYYTASIRPFNLHNAALQTLTEYGIIIFALYVFMFILLARCFLRRRGGGLGGALPELCFAVMCAYPAAGIASSDMTHLAAVWMAPALVIACARVHDAPLPADPSGRRMLLDTFIDFGDMSSGSSVRPQRMYAAFRELGYDVVLLSGLQNRRRDRRAAVRAVKRELIEQGLPSFCYVEPPSGPFFNFCDHRLLCWLRRKGVPTGLFYRDAYWKFAPWWQLRGLKRTLIVFMQRFDVFIFRRTCGVVFFPTRSMAELFDFPAESTLPPASLDMALPRRALAHRMLYIGGTSPNYGTDILLKAFEMINERDGMDISLTLVCRRSEHEELLEAYKGRPWLEIRHASGDEELAPIYAASDAAVYPSRRDQYMDFSMPVKLFEYLSRALPVVCTSCREASNFVKNSGMGIVCSDTPEGLAAAIEKLYVTPGLYDRLRGNCLAALKNNLWTCRAEQATREIAAAGEREKAERATRG